MSTHKIKHLVLSGGGLLGISYIGLIKYFEEQNTLSNIESITGCSAGAIFGSLLSIGYTYKELNVIVKSMIFKDYLKINVDSLLNFVNTKGFESGRNLNLFIKKSIKEKTGDENITFSQIQEKYNIKLQIGVTNLTKSKFELFNIDTTPDISIINAISASIAIPFIFEPIIIGDDIYCDGGLLDNLPIENIIENTVLQKNCDKIQDKIQDKINDIEENKEISTGDLEKLNINKNDEDSVDTKENSFTTIGFYLINKIPKINKDNYQIISISQYINVITHTLSENFIYTKTKIENNNKKYKIIKIEIPCDIMTFIKLNATHDDIDNIIDIAYNITKNELNLVLPKTYI